jgi:CheY-like chemotaxis protein
MDKDLRKKYATLRVLVVDDQPEIRAIVREVLMDAGVAQIFEAANGREALSFVDTDMDLINFIISDWNMPALEGIDFLRQLRSVNSALPFLMVTGRCDKTSVIEARAAGVSAYIRKPFSPKQLEDKIKVLIQDM